MDEEERFSHRELQFGRKRFYFDPITQQRGHSIKITEVSLFMTGGGPYSYALTLIPFCHS